MRRETRLKRSGRGQAGARRAPRALLLMHIGPGAGAALAHPRPPLPARPTRGPVKRGTHKGEPGGVDKQGEGGAVAGVGGVKVLLQELKQGVLQQGRTARRDDRRGQVGRGPAASRLALSARPAPSTHGQPSSSQGVPTAAPGSVQACRLLSHCNMLEPSPAAHNNEESGAPCAASLPTTRRRGTAGEEGAPTADLGSLLSTSMDQAFAPPSSGRFHSGSSHMPGYFSVAVHTPEPSPTHAQSCTPGGAAGAGGRRAGLAKGLSTGWCRRSRAKLQTRHPWCSRAELPGPWRGNKGMLRAAVHNCTLGAALACGMPASMV